jgi:hypothetical protein
VDHRELHIAFVDIGKQLQHRKVVMKKTRMIPYENILAG